MIFFQSSFFCFLAKNNVSMTKSVTFGPFGPLLSFLKVLPKLIKNGNFQKLYFFSGLLCHTEPTKNMFLSPKLRLLVLYGLLRRLLKGPLNSSKSKSFKYDIFLHYFVILSLHTESLCLYTHKYIFWPLGPFLKIKGLIKGSKMQIFKNSYAHMPKSIKVPLVWSKAKKDDQGAVQFQCFYDHNRLGSYQKVKGHKLLLVLWPLISLDMYQFKHGNQVNKYAMKTYSIAI